ncbi:hypothetical protein ABZ806_26140 [Spirillospora sp. NPDC047418]
MRPLLHIASRWLDNPSFPYLAPLPSLDRPGAAVPLYPAVLDDDGRSPRDRAYYRARLAAALSAAGDQREAVAEALRVVGDLGEGLTSTRVLSELRPVRSGTRELTLDINLEFRQRFDAAERALAAT